MPHEAERFVVEAFEPAYRTGKVAVALNARARAAAESLRPCRGCPRNCGADRLADELGFCRTGRLARVSSAFAHVGEESCLVGSHGSGTIFFAGCNLGCVFCQNWDISQSDTGTPASAQDLAALMLALQARGCHNINLVTPTHVVPQIIEAIAAAVPAGLQLPIVYNTSAYDSVESIRRLDGLIDIYMPDFKLWSAPSGQRYLHAPDYADRAREAIAEMHRQVGDLRFTPEGTACRGLLVRHLVMPGLLQESAEVFQWLARELSPDTFVNVMGQYRPANRVGRTSADEGCPAPGFAEIDRHPTLAEIDAARRLARQAGLWRFDE